MAASFLFPAQSAPVEEPKTVISMALTDYRAYLKSNAPLDRLYISGEECFFLVGGRELAGIKNRGVHVREQLLPHPGLSRPLDTVNGLYHNYLEIESLFLELAAQYPDLASVSSIGRSVEGREIYVMKISDNVTNTEAEPNIFISGCHHAREWISVEMPVHFARFLLENYPGDARVKKAVDGAQIYILPLLNPDGLEFSIQTYRMWRKNRAVNGAFSWGVDLNRNYGYAWGYDNVGSSPSINSAVYRGPAPFSEPETMAVRAFLTANPPSAALNFHNHSQKILYAWGYTAEPTADDAEMEKIAREMSELIFQVNGRVYTYGAGAVAIYPTNGDTDDWIYGTFGAFSFTVELPYLYFYEGGFITSEEEIQISFAEHLPAMLYFVNYFVDGAGDDGSEPAVRPHPGKRKPLPNPGEK